MRKRVFDVVLASALIIPIAPVMGAVAIGVAVNIGQPLIFKQKRRGKNDEIFTIYKFRSMKDLRDENGALLPDNKRTTRFGQFIRVLGLDELPQLLNILKGDMSFVGPRPRAVHSPNNNHIPDTHKDILSVLPGLTGPAQIKRLHVRQDLSLQEKLKLDWEYATQPENVTRDLGMIVQTLPIFVRGNGSERDRQLTAQPR